jgi:hypothetical protein
VNEIDESLIQRLASLSPGTQRWLKTALQSIGTMPGPHEPDDGWSMPLDLPAPIPASLAADPPMPPDMDGEPLREHASPLEDVITGRANLDEQLESYPELADELEGIGDVIDMLRDLGESRRRRGEDILREEILGQDPEDPDRDELT